MIDRWHRLLHWLYERHNVGHPCCHVCSQRLAEWRKQQRKGWAA